MHYKLVIKSNGKGNNEFVYKEVIKKFNQVFGSNMDKDDSTRLHIDFKYFIDPIPNTWGWYGTVEFAIIDRLNNQIIFFQLFLLKKPSSHYFLA